MRNIALCGFMGSGKTYVSKLLAEALDCPVLDTDALIVEAAGKSIPQIFAEDGEAAFRDLESDAVKKAAGGKGKVISLGGGALLRADSAEAVRSNCLLIFIDTPFEVCYSRISSDPDRPIAAAKSKEQLSRLFDYRRGICLSHAHAVQDGSASGEDIVSAILSTSGRD